MNLSDTSRKFLRELVTILDSRGWIEVDTDWATTLITYPTVLIGNGGSATIASHICNDLVKSGLQATIPDYATLTCLANDFGWENAFAKYVYTMRPATLIAISSSGRSQNIINACKVIGKSRIITLTGFDPDNPVRQLGRTNYYVPSHNYGIVECAHLAILHSLVNPGTIG